MSLDERKAVENENDLSTAVTGQEGEKKKDSEEKKERRRLEGKRKEGKKERKREKLRGVTSTP